MKQKRIIITISPYLRKILEKTAKKRGCSQAEVLRTGILIQYKEDVL